MNINARKLLEIEGRFLGFREWKKIRNHDGMVRGGKQIKFIKGT